MQGNLRYSNAAAVPTASAGGCDVITNATIGWAGLLYQTHQQLLPDSL
ncbi:MAG: hypothetical protein WDM90_12925 [Ferruginibacter sp.]